MAHIDIREDTKNLINDYIYGNNKSTRDVLFHRIDNDIELLINEVVNKLGCVNGKRNRNKIEEVLKDIRS